MSMVKVPHFSIKNPYTEPQVMDAFGTLVVVE